MKLEVKHLIGYLPYGLKVSNNLFPDDINIVIGLKNETYFIENGNKYAYGDIYSCKPILRPLSDLTKEIEVNGEKFIPMDKLAEIDEVVCICYSIEFFETSMQYLPYWIVEKMYEWHLDIHGLIENNLAIDINTLEK